MNQHKDLPSGSQTWAKEVDAAMAKIKELEEVIRRLTENAGIDYSNPKRGMSTGSTPSINNPVGQKLSSLADVSTYNVLNNQVLTWDQAQQRWNPQTPLAVGGSIDISEVTYSGLSEGYGVLTDVDNYAYTAGGMDQYGNYNIENWATKTQYMGAGNWVSGPVALVLITRDGSNRPWVQLSAEDFADGSHSSFEVYSYGMRVNSALFKPPTTLTVDRPTPDGGLGITGDPGCQSYDLDLGIPIWWNGTAWTDALGTAV